MLFLEPWFWAFAGVAVPGYWLVPRRGKLIWLLCSSAVFLGYFAGPAGVAPIVALAGITYLAGLPARPLPAPGFALVFGVVGGALAFYKYSELLVHSAADLLALASDAGFLDAARAWRQPAAPLAISFFTFEFLHYLYEVHVRGRAPVRNPLHFAVFALFFPTLAAGPIKRFPDFVPQLEDPRNPSPAAVWEGARRVIRGLFKKVCIADLLVEPIGVFEDAHSWALPLVLLLAVLQGFRIYYDFAGYSDIAIGFARMLNLRVPENFDRPYLSTSLADFWRRWHMSLSYWIRDYVYIPMGGNRAHRGLNLLAAMALCGLWHGAAWHFVAWGVYHGAGLLLERLVQQRFPRLFQGGRSLALARWACCYAFVTYGWLLFFYPFETVYAMTVEGIAWCWS